MGEQQQTEKPQVDWAQEHELNSLVYEFTTEPKYLSQYHALRDQEVKRVLEADEYDGGENEYDKTGYTLIARMGETVVGGIRLDIKSPEIRRPLPMEFDGFEIENHFPHLKEQNLSYMQISFMTLHPRFRGGRATFELSKRITHKAVELNCAMFFCIAPILNARVYKRNGSAVGFKDVVIHRDIELPKFKAFEDIKLYLVSCSFDVGLIEKNQNTEL